MQKRAREKDAALCIHIFALGALILYMLQYALLFICWDIDVSHELAGCVCEGDTHKGRGKKMKQREVWMEMARMRRKRKWG